MASRWTFVSTDAFVGFMEHERLDEVLLADIEPLPTLGALPTEVRFTWWSHDKGGRVPYRARARGVGAWQLTGARDEAPIGFGCGAGKGVHLVMTVPSDLELRCDELEVKRGRREKL